MQRAAWLVMCIGMLACDTAEEVPSARVSPNMKTDAATCARAQAAFDTQVWPKVLQPRCLGCHGPGKVAAKRQARFVLAGDPQTAAGRRQNLEALTRMGRLEHGGEPWVLLKPTGRTSHGGGHVMTPDSEPYRILADFVTADGFVEACGDEGALPAQ